jgi:hypothetical protein
MDGVKRCLLVTLLIAACTSPSPAPSAAPEKPDTQPGSAPAAPRAVATGASAAQPAATPPAPAACARDADCAWEDPCRPTRCVPAAAQPPAAGCDKSVPPEGTCVCFDRRCAYRPAASRSPVSVDAACTSPPDCILDAASGTCTPGSDPDTGHIGEPGPHCRCDRREPRRCHYVWIDPVPCSSDDDCWVSNDGFTHPIARPKKLRGRRFRPCKDGEEAPVCRAGSCTVQGYTC